MGELVEHALSLLQEDRPGEARALLAQWVAESPQDSRGLELLALAERLARDTAPAPEFSESELHWFSADDGEMDAAAEPPRYRLLVFAAPAALVIAVASALWLSAGSARGSDAPIPSGAPSVPSPAPQTTAAPPQIPAEPAAPSRPAPKRLLTSADHHRTTRRLAKPRY